MPPEDHVELKDLEQCVFAHCHILTGRKCVATGGVNTTAGANLDESKRSSADLKTR
jgi:hypothetical protein